jgi:hypothetical protein
VTIAEVCSVLESHGYGVFVNYAPTAASRRGANAGRGYRVWAPGATNAQVLSLAAVRKLARTLAETPAPAPQAPATPAPQAPTLAQRRTLARLSLAHLTNCQALAVLAAGDAAAARVRAANPTASFLVDNQARSAHRRAIRQAAADLI